MSFNITANPFSLLRHVHPNLSGRITHIGGGGGGSAPQPTTTTQNINQNSIPREFMPYFTRMLGRGEAASLQPYQPYGGPRMATADQFADIGASREMARGVAGAGVPGLDLAQETARGNIDLARGLGQFGPGQFSEFQFGPARQFTGQEVQQYMSPYIENVLDVQKSRAVEDFDRLRGARNTRAVQAGAFGGSRQGVQEGMAEEALLRQMGEIEAGGRQAAFDRAGQLFGADRAAQMAQMQAQAGELGRVQTGTEASRQFGAGQGLAALGAAGAEAGRLTALGEQERAAGIQGAQLLEGIGKAQQGEVQAGLDIGYQDFLRQQGFPMEQLGNLSAMLRGLPIAPAGTQTSTQTGFQYVNPVQQGLGAGLSALSLYKAFA
jgi:hypothetical protein